MWAIFAQTFMLQALISIRSAGSPQEMAEHVFVGSPNRDDLIAALYNRAIPVRAESFAKPAVT